MHALFVITFVPLICFTYGAWVKEMENDGLYEGDIVLNPEQKARLKLTGNAFGSKNSGRWYGAKIPYVVDKNFDDRGRWLINQAIGEYHKHTCLKFTPWQGEKNYVFFSTRGGGCSSPVGTGYGQNTITLPSGCRYKGIIMHEIGHTIGLYHEQSRPDRDNYVNILWNNIPRGMQYNFYKHSDINSLGTRYDFSSMMHYAQDAFGGGRMTIQAKDSRNQPLMGQRTGFSRTDVKQINLMYCSNRGK